MFFSFYVRLYYVYFFFFNDPATTEIYTLSLHDALPILRYGDEIGLGDDLDLPERNAVRVPMQWSPGRSEEHTSELQSRPHLVCRLLLEKKKTTHTSSIHINST